MLQAILPVFWFVLKVFCFLFLYIWVRGTLPRFRYDQLMGFGWKFLMPLAIANILATSLWLALARAPRALARNRCLAMHDIRARKRVLQSAFGPADPGEKH